MALLARGVPDGDACLVLDVDMPDIGGGELERALAAADREFPTIFITALEPAKVSRALAAFVPVGSSASGPPTAWPSRPAPT